MIQKTNPVMFSLEAILNGEFYVLRPDEKSRVYTNLTNLKRECRAFLRYDDKPLVELDIRNSQPLIASIIIKEYGFNNVKAYQQILYNIKGTVKLEHSMITSCN